MPDCSLCKSVLPPEGGAILFTDSRGVPFEVCEQCEVKIAPLFDSEENPFREKALEYIAECIDTTGQKDAFGYLLHDIKQNGQRTIKKKLMNKKLKAILILVAIAAVVGLSSLFIATTVSNEHAFQRFSNQLFSYQLPDKTAKVNEVCDRSIGSGSLEFTAFMLIKSDLKLDELKAYYEKAGFQPAKTGKRNSMTIAVREISDAFDLYFAKTVGDDWQHKYYDDTSTYTSYYVVYLNDSGYSYDFDLKYIR